MTMNRAGRGYLRLGLVQYYLPIAPQALLVGIALVRPKGAEYIWAEGPLVSQSSQPHFEDGSALPST